MTEIELEDEPQWCKDGSVMPFSTLPYELHLKILLFLSARELCNYERVCKDWRAHQSVLNEVWWKLCMAEWWDKSDRPKYMSKNDKKKKWKESFSRISPDAAKDKVFVKTSGHKELITVENYQPPVLDAPAGSGNYKVDMRAFYKSIRSKPKGKLQRGQRRAGLEDYD